MQVNFFFEWHIWWEFSVKLSALLLIKVPGLRLVFFLILSDCFLFLCLITGSTPTHTPSSNSTDREKDRSSAGRRRGSSAKFQPPEQPPARKDWVPDTQQLVCMVCQRERFTMVSGQNGVTLTGVIINLSWSICSYIEYILYIKV